MAGRGQDVLSSWARKLMAGCSIQLGRKLGKGYLRDMRWAWETQGRPCVNQGDIPAWAYTKLLRAFSTLRQHMLHMTCMVAQPGLQSLSKAITGVASLTTITIYDYNFRINCDCKSRLSVLCLYSKIIIMFLYVMVFPLFESVITSPFKLYISNSF